MALVASATSVAAPPERHAERRGRTRQLDSSRGGSYHATAVQRTSTTAPIVAAAFRHLMGQTRLALAFWFSAEPGGGVPPPPGVGDSPRYLLRLPLLRQPRVGPMLRNSRAHRIYALLFAL